MELGGGTHRNTEAVPIHMGSSLRAGWTQMGFEIKELAALSSSQLLYLIKTFLYQSLQKVRRDFSINCWKTYGSQAQSDPS